MRNVDSAEAYARIIMEDETENIASEVPTVYESDHIERIYTFHDGAIVSYEWRDASAGTFNHCFTLVRPPAENVHGFQPGTIKTIGY